jgi:50S ribosomal protein uL3
MSLGLVGRKVGMTRIFAEDGASIPVTVLDVSNNRVTQVKTPEIDGYAAIQVAFGKRRASRVSKPLAGHLAKAGVEAGHVLKEFRIDADQLASFKAGDQVAVTIFAEGQKVDVTGTSIGKGFQGGIKRHNFSSNRATHGNSCRITRRVPLVWRRIRVVFSRVSAWPVTWVMCSLRCRADDCARRFRAPAVAGSWCRSWRQGC